MIDDNLFSKKMYLTQILMYNRDIITNCNEICLV